MENISSTLLGNYGFLFPLLEIISPSHRMKWPTFGPVINGHFQAFSSRPGIETIKYKKTLNTLN
jgi:hypothetical protein